MPHQTGEVLVNRYRIVQMLKTGGLGVVYRAWDLNLNRPCAVKENLDPAAASQAQFQREATMLANLFHPNLPRVWDHFVIAGQGQYLVMDFVDGQDLETLMASAGGSLPEAQVLPWIGEICQALSYLHTQTPPVIHRDVKPGNIRVRADGRAVLVDFGIAKVYDPALRTTAGARAVTPGYSPPEQYGRGSTDARSDVYALGATLYTLLTGQEPAESVQRFIGAQLAPPRSLNPAISLQTEEAVLHALQLRPEHRFQSVQEFWLALTRANVPVRVSPPGPTLVFPAVVPARATAGRSLAWAGAALVVVLFGGVLLVGALGLGAWLGSRALALRPNQTPTPLGVPTQPAKGATAAPTRLTTTPTIATPRATPTGVPPTPTAPGPTPQLDIGSTQVSPADRMVLVYVPAGTFLMGSADTDPDARTSEKPQHTVYLDAYWIDRTVVTNSQYERCVNAGACQPPSDTSSATRSFYYANPDFWNYPVIHMSWIDANTYCSWAGRRLPTEAEWEKAARGQFGELYPWGNGAPNDTLLNYNEAVGDTTAVGSYPLGASPYGALDMAGNVWEWVADWYGDSYYAQAPYANPTGPTTGQFRVLRSGTWRNDAQIVRAALRLSDDPGYQAASYGFRCAG